MFPSIYTSSSYDSLIYPLVSAAPATANVMDSDDDGDSIMCKTMTGLEHGTNDIAKRRVKGYFREKTEALPGFEA